MNWYLAGLLLSTVALCATAMEKDWKLWKEEHRKVYADAVDEQKHKTIWMANYHQIKDHNRKGHSYTLGLNQFSDMVRMACDL